jgi:hypothetical protein
MFIISLYPNYQYPLINTKTPGKWMFINFINVYEHYLCQSVIPPWPLHLLIRATHKAAILQRSAAGLIATLCVAGAWRAGMDSLRQ